MSTVTVTPASNRTAKLLPILNIAAFIVVIVANALANILPLNGLTTGAISDSFPSFFTPAGYVFAIWGLIYLLLGVFVVYQALPAQRNNPRLERLGYLFVLSCTLNVAWLFSWHFLLIPLSMLVMLGLLASLIMIYERLEIGKNEVTRAETFAVRLPFSVYLGWITVATVANFTVTLLGFGVQVNWAAPFWAFVTVLAAAAIGLTVLRRRNDVAFVLVLVWAFFGIAVRQWGSEALLVLGAAAAASYLAFQIVRHVRAPTVSPNA